MHGVHIVHSVHLDQLFDGLSQFMNTVNGRLRLAVGIASRNRCPSDVTPHSASAPGAANNGAASPILPAAISLQRSRHSTIDRTTRRCRRASAVSGRRRARPARRRPPLAASLPARSSGGAAPHPRQTRSRHTPATVDPEKALPGADRSPVESTATVARRRPQVKNPDVRSAADHVYPWSRSSSARRGWR